MRARFCPSAAAAVVKRDEGLYSAAAAVVDTNGRMDSGKATRSCRIFCNMSARNFQLLHPTFRGQAEEQIEKGTFCH